MALIVGYQSIGILSSCLSRVCVLLTWSFSFPNRRWPNSISCCESVPQKDAERVINLAREVFPMMSLSCDYVLLQLQQSKYHCQELSPTNALCVCWNPFDGELKGECVDLVEECDNELKRDALMN